MAATYFGMHKKIPFPGLALDSGLCQSREQAFLFFSFFLVPNYGGQHCVAFEVLLNRKYVWLWYSIPNFIKMAFERAEGSFHLHSRYLKVVSINARF